MSKKVMLINVTDDESRIAIVEDNILQEMLIEHQTREQIKNNICKAVVVQVNTGLQAAFVDFGNKKHGFLPSNEINPRLYQKKSHKTPIQKVLQRGQSFIVQVTREAVDNKGAALSTNISIPGRFMVLMPDSDKGGVSKRIEDQNERDRLKGFLSGIESEDHAVIIRTAGANRDLLELKKDYTHLKKSWEDIQVLFNRMEKPGLIREEDDVVTRTLRDYYTEDIKEIWVDNAEAFQKALTFLKKTTPRRQKDLKLFVGDRSLFATYKIERQVEQLTAREISLKSGGSIVIEQTEALVSIDVNSGKSNQEENIDDTALRTNLEAADEIARQLRLRNLAGLVVVDFIDMETESARQKVEQQIQASMSRDKAQRKYNPISQFGLMEMSRQRLTIGISRTVESICPTCNGKGRISSILASTNLIIRTIREMAARGNLLKVDGELPLELANHLLNERRQSITDLELEFGIHILLRGNPNLTVFNERQIKSAYSGKSQQRHDSGSQVSDKQKYESHKKSGKQPDTEVAKQADEKKQISEKKTQKDKSPKKAKRNIKTDVASDIKLLEEGTSTDKTEVPQSNSKKPKTATVESENETLHPSCLFQDVQELSEEVLEEVTTSFENRLKGKADNQVFKPIDPKYLWSANGSGTSDESEDAGELNVQAQTEDAKMPDSDETGNQVKAAEFDAEPVKSEKSLPGKKRKTSQTAAKKRKKTDEKQLKADKKISKKEKEQKPAKKAVAIKSKKVPVEETAASIEVISEKVERASKKAESAKKATGSKKESDVKKGDAKKSTRKSSGSLKKESAGAKKTKIEKKGRKKTKPAAKKTSKTEPDKLKTTEKKA